MARALLFIRRPLHTLAWPQEGRTTVAPVAGIVLREVDVDDSELALRARAKAALSGRSSLVLLVKLSGKHSPTARAAGRRERTAARVVFDA